MRLWEQSIENTEKQQKNSNSMEWTIFCTYSFLFLPIYHIQAISLLVHHCYNATAYTSGSQFQTNLSRLLLFLSFNGGKYGFLRTSIGEVPDKVYGLAQCRHDIPVGQCLDCLLMSMVEIVKSCPTQKEAVVIYDYCILHYSSNPLSSHVDRTIWYNPGIDQVHDADVLNFNQQLEILMRTMAYTAASVKSKSESGSLDYSSFGTIYGSLQCTRDLSHTNCFSCLQSIISKIPDCCDGSGSAWIATTTCALTYASNPFPGDSRTSVPLPPAGVEPPLTVIVNRVSKKVAVIAVSVIVAALFSAISAYFINRKRKQEILGDEDDIGIKEGLLFDLNIIRVATSNFSDANKLGQGGFGAVYKGELLDGQDIAVKRLSKNSRQGSQEFKNEVLLLHKLQHRNLVRLLGFCLGGEEKLLIYEFVPNRSLDQYIFDPTKKSCLDWENRYNIIGGIARGLLYLHEDSSLRIIHRDLKAGNILLDNAMNPKIADFGMAKLFEVDQTGGNTSEIAGTFGYMAPEYVRHGLFSVKSDVFSFGVVMLEILSGQSTCNFSPSGSSWSLLSHAWHLWREENALQLIDPILIGNLSVNEAMRCIHIALLCVQNNLDKRPTMSSVILMLNNSSFTLEIPSSPAFTSENMAGVDHRSSSLLYSDDGLTLPR